MNYAIASIKDLKSSEVIVLWTMNKNMLSQKFYSRFGFIKNGEIRISRRINETFEEIQFEYITANSSLDRLSKVKLVPERFTVPSVDDKKDKR